MLESPMDAETVAPETIVPPAEAEQPITEQPVTDQEAGELDADALEPAEPEVKAPASLNAEGKALFATLPPEAQKWWSETETTRARQVTEATTRAAERERAAQSQAEQARVQAQSTFAQQLQSFAAAYQPQQPNPADYTDMQAFARDDAQYRYAMQQHGELMQRVQAIGAEAQQGMTGMTQQHVEQEQRQLHAAFPEWFDADKGPGHRERLTTVGSELGYPPELMAQADAKDVLALRTAAEWKDKASKYDKLMSARMASVRAGRQPPPNARGVAPNTQAAPVRVADALYPNDVRR